MNLLIIQPGILDKNTAFPPVLSPKTAKAVTRILSEIPITALYTAPARWASKLLSHTNANTMECPWLKEFSFPLKTEDASAFLTPEQNQYGEWTDLSAKSAYVNTIRQLDSILEQHGYRRDGRQYRVINANSYTLTFLCPLGAACALLSHFLHLSPVALRNTLVPENASVFTLVSKKQPENIADFVMTSSINLP